MREQGVHEMEQTREREAIVVGRLGDLGLGNPDGIPSNLAGASAEELQEAAERDNERLVEPNDLSCTACIDGRRCKCNADGSEAKIRLRRVGGSASDLGVALNADAPVVATLDLDAPLDTILDGLEVVTGPSSAHLGGCGGANGEVADHRSIHEKSQIMTAVEAAMSIPAIRDYLGVDFDAAAAEQVRQQAKHTADFLEAKGWVGQEYVDRARRNNPQNVEDLEVDETDEKFHGHREPKLTIIAGDKTMPLDDDGFVWNLKATKEMATRLAGQGGADTYRLLVIADAAKHMAVADRLPSTETPIFFQAA